MPRFVIASKRAGKFRETDKASALNSFEAFSTKSLRGSSEVNVLNEAQQVQSDGRKISIIETSSEKIKDLVENLPDDVILEPEYFYKTSVVHPLGLNRLQDLTPSDGTSVFGSDAEIVFTVRGGGAPLVHAEVVLNLRIGNITDQVKGITNANGQVSLRFSSLFTPTVALAIPYSAFWTTVSFNPSPRTTITCSRLPRSGPQDWRHRAMGTPRAFNPNLGAGIKVGVIDSGCGPHGNLNHVTDAGSVVDGVRSTAANAGADSGSHGTHVCGIIGARPQSAGEYGGIAPATELTSIRVFGEAEGASNADIATAIDILSMTHEADLINMSLGGPNTSLIISDSIIDALERGTLCVVAAGNSSGAVEYPARHDDCVAVSAIGLLGEAPDGTLSALRVPDNPDEIGLENLFMSTFSCRGTEIDLAGPGVGVISTVPERHGLERPYAGMDGTSMASPAVAGAIAAILSKNPTYSTLERNTARAEFARNIGQQFARDIGLHSDLQGRGMPQIAGVNPNRDVDLIG